MRVHDRFTPFVVFEEEVVKRTWERKCNGGDRKSGGERLGSAVNHGEEEPALPKGALLPASHSNARGWFHQDHS